MWQPSVLVFDGDDTLWMNEWQYSDAYTEFFHYLYEQLRDLMPNFNSVKSRFAAIDKQLFDTWGVKRGRVAEAMLLTFSEIVLYMHSVAYTRKPPETVKRLLSSRRIERIEMRIREIGDKPFQVTKVRWLPGAKEIIFSLGRYNGQGNRTALLTSYDPTVWKRKQRLLFAGEMPFDRVRVISGKKTAADFIEVSAYGGHPKGIKFYAIGNGPSDILPALEVSNDWYGIYIPHGSTSAYFSQERTSFLHLLITRAL